MIQIANNEHTDRLRSMWKICFGDTDEYIDFVFEHKYKPENTLVYFEGDRAVASLQMLPYTIRFYGQVIPFYYLAGLCTLPQCRAKGYMGRLMEESFKLMQLRSIALTLLVPADDGLFNYYAKYGFETVFDKRTEPITLQSILEKYPNNIDQAFDEFDKKYQQTDFTVLKNRTDFKLIVQENRADNYAPKFRLSAMARIIDPGFLLKLYAAQNKEQMFLIKVLDTVYQIKQGKACVVTESNFDLEVDIVMLCRLLFGYHTSDLPSIYSNHFHENQPVIHLMLE